MEDTGLQAKKALVVDDNAANSLILASMVENLGLAVTEAGSGKEAIEDFCTEEYDLILMDHLMPEMDGIETASRILFLAEGRKQPVIFGVTSTVDAETVDAFEQAGAVGVLEKPVRLEHLQQALEKQGLLDSESSAETVSEEENSQEAKSNQENPVGELLSQVEGLDYEAGLSMLAGNVENYMRVLGVAVKNISDNYQAIELLDDTPRHMENARLYFHSLKGIFLNIGVQELAETSRHMEELARQEQYDSVRDRLPDYRERIQSFLTALQRACESYRQEKLTSVAEAGKSFSDSTEKLQELRAHIEDFEYIEITELLEQLLAGADSGQREKLQDISNAIENFEYDEALALTDALIEFVKKME